MAIKMNVSSPRVSMTMGSPAVNMSVRNAADVVYVDDPSAKFETDETLKLEDGILSVNTTDKIEAGNILPVTSAAVYVTVGNIEVLLKTI